MKKKHKIDYTLDNYYITIKKKRVQANTNNIRHSAEVIVQNVLDVAGRMRRDYKGRRNAETVAHETDHRSR